MTQTRVLSDNKIDHKHTTRNNEHVIISAQGTPATTSSLLLNLIPQGGPLFIVGKYLTNKDLTSLTSHSKILKSKLHVELEERRLLNPLRQFLLHKEIQEITSTSKKDEKSTVIPFPSTIEIFKEKSSPENRLIKILQVIKEPLTHYLKNIKKQFNEWNALQSKIIPQPIVLLFKSKRLQESLQKQLPNCYLLFNDIRDIMFTSIRMLAKQAQLTPQQAIEKLQEINHIDGINSQKLIWLDCLTMERITTSGFFIPFVTISDSFITAQTIASSNFAMANALISTITPPLNSDFLEKMLTNTIQNRLFALIVAFLVWGVTLKNSKSQLPDLIQDFPDDYRELITMIVTNGKNIDAPNAKGQTALMLAVQLHDYYLAEALLKAGANVRKFDHQGKNALMYAINDYANKHHHFATRFFDLLIKQYGADLNQRNFNNKTVFDLSANYYGLKQILLFYKKSEPPNQTPSFNQLLNRSYDAKRFGHNPNLMYALSSDRKSAAATNPFHSFKR